MKPGDRIQFIGCDSHQQKWGGNYTDHSVLKVGQIYTLAKEEVHSWHTVIELEEVNGRFNSVTFVPWVSEKATQ